MITNGVKTRWKLQNLHRHTFRTYFFPGWTISYGKGELKLDSEVFCQFLATYVEMPLAGMIQVNKSIG